MTVWVFGDSYSAQYQEEWTWCNVVANQLNDEIKNLSMCGSALEYTYIQFEDQIINFQKDDIIILTLTSHHRTFFSPNDPWLCVADTYKNRWISSSAYGVLNRASIEYREYKAYELYLNHLYNYKTSEINLINFLYRVESIVNQHLLKNILFHCFDYEFDISSFPTRYPLLNFVPGNLYRTSLKEFEDEDVASYFLSTVGDKRANHFSKSNHSILANKVVNYLQHQTEINLTTEFRKMFINRQMIDDNNFRRQEFLFY